MQEKPTLDQLRASHAWKAVQTLGRPGPDKDRCEYDGEAQEYAREARKLPTRIQASGLGQALAFLAAKAKEKKKGLGKLLADLTDWVVRQRRLAADRPGGLLECVVFGDALLLRQATDETLSYLLWLNRFTEAEKIAGGES
jgi:CRISPR-associated protein Cmr5